MDEYDLEEIKREIVESRSLTIKTNNLVNALSADLKSIAKRQQGYERRMWFTSATAYVVTIAVVFITLKLAWDARVDAVRAETKGTRERLEQLDKELKAAQAREESTARASRRSGAACSRWSSPTCTPTISARCSTSTASVKRPCGDDTRRCCPTSSRPWSLAMRWRVWPSGTAAG